MVPAWETIDRRPVRADDLGPCGDDPLPQSGGRLAAGPVDLGVPGGELGSQGRVACGDLVERPALSVADVDLLPAVVDLEDRWCGMSRQDGSGVVCPLARARHDPDPGRQGPRQADRKILGGSPALGRQGRIAPAAVALAGQRGRGVADQDDRRHVGPAMPAESNDAISSRIATAAMMTAIASAAPDASPRRRSSSRIGTRPRCSRMTLWPGSVER